MKRLKKKNPQLQKDFVGKFLKTKAPRAFPFRSQHHWLNAFKFESKLHAQPGNPDCIDTPC